MSGRSQTKGFTVRFVSGSSRIDPVAWLEQTIPDPALPVSEAVATQLRDRAESIVAQLERLEPETKAWTVARLRAYWVNGHYAEGREWATRVAEGPDVSAAALSRVLEVAATTAFEQGDEGEARRTPERVSSGLAAQVAAVTA